MSIEPAPGRSTAMNGAPDSAPDSAPAEARAAETALADRPVILRATDLRKRYGSLQAVAGVSIEIREGETYGLLGPNGAGKTTTISMVCGLLARDAGDVTIDGQPMDVGKVAAKAGIGYVPQDLAIYPDLTALENLRFFGRLYGMGGATLDRRVQEVLEVVDLRDRAKERTEQYSGGMKRRLNIAIGLLHTPRLLVLDEPTVGVDPQSRNAILESVGRLSTEGMAILYTTHYMEEAQELCDRLAIIDHGKVIALGTLQELRDMMGARDLLRLSGTFDPPAAAAALDGLDHVEIVTAEPERLIGAGEGASRKLPGIFAALSAAGAEVRETTLSQPSLEALFIKLHGRELRE